MYAVVIHHNHEVSPEAIQALAEVLGVTVFDARQKLAGQGPVVISTYAQSAQAESILTKLKNNEFRSFISDVDAALNDCPVLVVEKFELNEDHVSVYETGGRKATIAYKDIKFILPSVQRRKVTKQNSVTERKLSIGKTVMMGGLPMSKKVTRQETVMQDEPEHVLYLCGGNRARLVCRQNSMTFEGFKDEIEFTREMNYKLFISKICQSCPDAVYEDRLMKRLEQAKLLGPTLNPDCYIDLAVDILITSALAEDRK